MGWIIYKNLPAYQICYLLFQMLECRNQHLTHLSCGLQSQHSKHPATIATPATRAPGRLGPLGPRLRGFDEAALTWDLLVPAAPLIRQPRGEGHRLHCQVCFSVCLNFLLGKWSLLQAYRKCNSSDINKNISNKDKYNILAELSIKSKSRWNPFRVGLPRCFECRAKKIIHQSPLP